MPEDIVNKLDQCMDFNCVFKLVKAVVREYLGFGRAGLMLVLADLPAEVEGYHQVGSNSIVINRRRLRAVLHGAGSRRVVNAYLFHLLLHEYLHSLGSLGESETRRIAFQLCRDFFGADHPVSQIASQGSQAILRENWRAQNLPFDAEQPSEYEVVNEFDSDSASYIR